MNEQQLKERLMRLDERDERHNLPEYRVSLIDYLEYDKFNSDESFVISRNPRFTPTPDHSHDFVELNFMFEGECDQVIDGKPQRLKKNQMTLIDTNTTHSIGVLDEDDVLINFTMSREFVEKYLISLLDEENTLSYFFANTLNPGNTSMNYIVFDVSENERILNFLYELLWEQLYPTRNSRKIKETMMQLILMDLVGSGKTVVEQTSLSPSNQIILRALQYMEKNFLNCSLKQMAIDLHVHQVYLTSLLKEQTGLSYSQHISRLKLEKIKRMLLERPDLSIEEISTQCGYSNQTFFYSKFKEAYHMTPRQYRQEALKHWKS